eukprot:2381529-Pleurochrysis_carterae.AAC.1
MPCSRANSSLRRRASRCAERSLRSAGSLSSKSHADIVTTASRISSDMELKRPTRCCGASLLLRRSVGSAFPRKVLVAARDRDTCAHRASVAMLIRRIYVILRKRCIAPSVAGESGDGKAPLIHHSPFVLILYLTVSGKTPHRRHYKHSLNILGIVPQYPKIYE